MIRILIVFVCVNIVISIFSLVERLEDITVLCILGRDCPRIDCPNTDPCPFLSM